jgi:hypothetical protein
MTITYLEIISKTSPKINSKFKQVGLRGEDATHKQIPLDFPKKKRHEG